jgi:hypothetical protein
MKRLLKKLVGVFLIYVVGFGSFNQTMAGEKANRDEERPFRLYATAEVAPIGSITSFSDATSNGKTISGTQSIWGGETIQSGNASARLTVENVGQVSLAAGSLARFSKSETTLDDGTRGATLIATVVTGSVKIKLQKKACAYLETGGRIFHSTPGASFRVEMIRGELPALTIESGDVQTQANPVQRKYTIRPVGMGAKLSVRARATRQIQVQVTDENDKPVPDVPILFALGGGGGGGFGSGTAVAANVSVTTNAQGIATTTFTAGPGASQTSITATVPGSDASWTGEVKVNSSSGVLNPTTVTILAAVAAGVIVGVVVANNDNNPSRDPIQAQNPNITPR